MERIIKHKAFQNIALLNLFCAPILILGTIGFKIFDIAPNYITSAIFLLLLSFGIATGYYLFKKGKEL